MITRNEIEKIWIGKEAVHILLKDGRQTQELFNNYHRLKYATAEQRANYTLTPFGIHWEEIDEDLSFDGFFKEKNQLTELGKVFKNLPDINVSAFARKMSIPQPVMASYLSGLKKPSKKRLEQIKKGLHQLGEELLAVHF